MKRLLLAALCVVSATACSVVAKAPALPGVTAPSRGSGAIDAGEAERIALRVAAERGYTEAKAEKVHHDEGKGGRWKVEIRGLANGRDGKLDVRVSDEGKVLDVKDHQKGDKGKDDKGKGKGKDK